MTTKYKRLYVLLVVTSLLLNVAPLVIYAIIALVESDLVYEKMALCVSVFTVLLMTIVSMVNKYAMRSRLWVLLIGLYICLEYILTPLIIIAVCQVVDEFVVCPLKVSYKHKFVIHKELDKRL